MQRGGGSGGHRARLAGHARGATPVQATLWGVFLHGEAGNRLARTRGPVGFLARELLAEIPSIMAEMDAPGA